MRHRNLVATSVTVLATIFVASAVGCAATPADHEYVTDYRVVGDRTVKYIYLPGERSRAGDAYLDQALAVEICSVESNRIDETDGDGDVDDDQRAEIATEADCQKTRILKTEEYR